MIQIDDAGSGSLVGGTLIGILRVESGEYYSEIIPIRLYSEKNFKIKLYLKYTTGIVKRAFKALDVQKDEIIAVCRGYMFDDLRKHLTAGHYKYISTKIGEPLQSKIEMSFEDYVVSLGLPRDFIKFTKYPFHFHRLLRWVYADYENRSKLCKTGWKSWHKYGYLKLDTCTDFIYNGNFHCLKCGKKIQKYSSVKVIKFTSNMPNIIYLHRSCP